MEVAETGAGGGLSYMWEECDSPICWLIDIPLTEAPGVPEKLKLELKPGAGLEVMGR